MISSCRSRTFLRLWYKEGRAWNGTHADLLLPEQRRGWSLLISCPRATRGLRRVGGELPDYPSCSQNAHDEAVLVRCAQ